MKKANPRDHFIIDTKTRTAPYGRDFEYLDFEANPAYKEIVEKAKDGRLAKENPSLRPELCANPRNFHRMEHMTPEVTKYCTDEDGLIWIPSHDVAVAQKLFAQLKAIDNEVSVSPFGMSLPEPTLTASSAQNTGRMKLLDRIRGH